MLLSFSTSGSFTWGEPLLHSASHTSLAHGRPHNSTSLNCQLRLL
jgi:hypothetical protein